MKNFRQTLIVTTKYLITLKTWRFAPRLAKDHVDRAYRTTCTCIWKTEREWELVWNLRIYYPFKSQLTHAFLCLRLLYQLSYIILASWYELCWIASLHSAFLYFLPFWGVLGNPRPVERRGNRKTRERPRWLSTRSVTTHFISQTTISTTGSTGTKMRMNRIRAWPSYLILAPCHDHLNNYWKSWLHS